MRAKQILCIIATISACLSFSLAHAKVITSFPVLTLITQDILGIELSDTLRVETLSPSGADAHHFDPSPKMLMDLQKSNLIIVNGLGFEHWLSRWQDKPEFKNRILVASAGVKTSIKQGHETDPHAWHHPDNLLVYIANIKQALIQKFPQHQAVLQQRAEQLQLEVQQWHQQTSKQLGNIGKPLLFITAHSGFAYFAQAFNLQYIALLGNHEGEAISPRQLTLKITELKKTLRRVFLGDNTEQDLQLKDWARKTQSPWGGELLGDSLDLKKKPLGLMQYLRHNSELFIKAFSTETKSSSLPTDSFN
jgi:ABC-type Zn uptake system ZnuABC Zn-binding protein ZnuA